MTEIFLYMKKLNDTFSIFAVVLIVTIAIYFYRFNRQNSHFNSQKFSISIENFKSDWGNPDKQIFDKSEMILFYNTKIMDCDKYVFKFDNNTKTLKSKFYDD